MAIIRSSTAVAVAQLVESQIVILVVVGSSPISHPNSPRVLLQTSHTNPYFVANTAASARLDTLSFL